MKITKSEGTTKSERYLARLCEATFLRLWSYPNVFRDQGRIGKGDGKELCDLLVVCGDYVIIFSDKSCEFKRTDNLQIDWGRWYRRAIEKSAAQIFGAERWIKEFPNRIFLDRECNENFPFPLPLKDKIKIHRIIVAVGAKEHCRKELRGSGSLWLSPSIESESHTRPFHVGNVDPKRGFVHVLDDVSLDVVLSQLDTITDLVEYLSLKEELVKKGKLQLAQGEENLLGVYVSHVNSNGKHDFGIPPNYDRMQAPLDYWNKVKSRPEFLRKKAANEQSYRWDDIINEFGQHILNGTILSKSIELTDYHERVVRHLAMESRFERRILVDLLCGALAQATPKQNFWRVNISEQNCEKAYVIGVIPFRDSKFSSYEKYREYRQKILHAYCFVQGWKCQELKKIIGIATEGHLGTAGASTDLVLLMPTKWTPEDSKIAKEYVKHFKFHNESNKRHASFQAKEYPDALRILSGGNLKRKIGRNDQCPCGSRAKYKHCCGRNQFL